MYLLSILYFYSLLFIICFILHKQHFVILGVKIWSQLDVVHFHCTYNGLLKTWNSKARDWETQRERAIKVEKDRIFPHFLLMWWFFFFLKLLAVSNYYANQCSVLAVVALSETMLGCCTCILIVRMNIWVKGGIQERGFMQLRKIKYACNVPTWQHPCSSILAVVCTLTFNFCRTARGSGALHHDMSFSKDWKVNRKKKRQVTECMRHIEWLSMSDFLSFCYPTSFYTLDQINRCLMMMMMMMIGGVGRA